MFVVVNYRNGTVVVDSTGPLVIPSADLPMVRKLLNAPAFVQRPVELPSGGVEERMVKIAPGEPGHVAAALRRLPDAAVVIDD